MKQRVIKYVFSSIYTLGVILVSLIPSSEVSVGHLDKVGHFAAYLVLAVLSLLTFKPGKGQVLALIFAVLLGAALEWGQSFVPGRDMSFLDGIANTLGVLAGLGLYRSRGQQIARFVDRFLS